MKLIKILSFALFATILTGCEKEMEKSASLDVTAVPSDNVKVAGYEITVKAGTPLKFSISGDPNVITFFSGEPGHEYKYRDRTEVDPTDIVSSVLKFDVWLRYGNGATAANLINMYVSDSFGGLTKTNFQTDSTSTVNHEWANLIPQTDLPQVPVSSASNASSYSIDMSPYLSKNVTLAIKYQGRVNTASQPQANFVGMKLVNTMKNGTVTTLMASNFNFTALNMDNGQTDRYKTVTNNTEGVWNLTGASAGNFFCHSTNAARPLRYSWLVSSPIKSNACNPDAGVAIKSLSDVLNSYTYTYNTPGTYTATFYGANVNYKTSSNVVKEVTIHVVQ